MTVLCVGDPLVALLPGMPTQLDQADQLHVHVGGAEVNTAIGLARLGVASSWLGRVGADRLGERVIRTLREEGVGTELVVIDPDAPTGLYLREWQPDGIRRPFYYRSGSAGSRLEATDWRAEFTPTALHITGITPALSPTAAAAIEAMVVRARGLGALVSFDPNYRPALWSSRVAARAVIGRLAAQADLVLMSEDDAELLVDSLDPERVFAAIEADQVVFKRGADGAIARRGKEILLQPAHPVRDPVDPVGAGDSFNAGFLAGLLSQASLADCLRLGALCGARTVAQVGEHSGAPYRSELPDALQSVLAER